MSDRSDRLFEIGREAGEKFDYFMAGLAAALTGYIAQSFNPTGFEPFSAASVEALAIVVLVASVASGVKRISLSNHLLQVGQKKIEQTEHLARSRRLAKPQRPCRFEGSGLFRPSRPATCWGSSKR
jgi:hypothetical protein